MAPNKISQSMRNVSTHKRRRSDRKGGVSFACEPEVRFCTSPPSVGNISVDIFLNA